MSDENDIQKLLLFGYKFVQKDLTKNRLRFGTQYTYNIGYLYKVLKLKMTNLNI